MGARPPRAAPLAAPPCTRRRGVWGAQGLQALEAMGFPNALAVHALQRSGNDLQRAADWLLDGGTLPDELAGSAAAAEHIAAVAQGGASGSSSGSGGDGGDASSSSASASASAFQLGSAIELSDEADASRVRGRRDPPGEEPRGPGAPDEPRDVRAWAAQGGFHCQLPTLSL